MALRLGPYLLWGLTGQGNSGIRQEEGVNYEMVAVAFPRLFCAGSLCLTSDTYTCAGSYTNTESYANFRANSDSSSAVPAHVQQNR